MTDHQVQFDEHTRMYRCACGAGVWTEEAWEASKRSLLKRRPFAARPAADDDKQLPEVPRIMLPQATVVRPWWQRLIDRLLLRSERVRNRLLKRSVKMLELEADIARAQKRRGVKLRFTTVFPPKLPPPHLHDGGGHE
jgi:hypothetical protein